MGVASGLLALLALATVAQLGSTAPLPEVAWAPSQNCDDSPGGNCAKCDQFDLGCLTCLPGYGFGRSGECRLCAGGSGTPLPYCLTCDPKPGSAKAMVCTACVNVVSSNSFSSANIGTPTYSPAAGECALCTNQESNEGCLTCNKAGTKCIACNEGYYKQTDGTCTKCKGTGCKRCDSEGNCLECQQPPTLGLTKHLGLDKGTQTCKECASIGCANCMNNYKRCVTCKSGYPNGGTRGFGKVPGSNPPRCLPCNSKLCGDCHKDYKFCTKCFTDRLPKPYATPSGTCKLCPVEGCLTCRSDGTCADCNVEGGYAKAPDGKSCEPLPKCTDVNCLDCRGGSCRQCARQYYLNPSTRQCQRISLSNAKCDKPTSVTTCQPGGCAFGYGYNPATRVCAECVSNKKGTNPDYSYCDRCDNNQAVCTLCWPANEFKPDPANPSKCKRYAYV